MVKPFRVQELNGLGLATLMARDGVEADRLARALEGAELAQTGSTRIGDMTLLATGPGVWMACSDGDREDFAAKLAAKLGGLASVSDQSGGYVVFELSGSGARRLLQRGASIDFHPDSFAQGSVAVTVVAHMGVTIWQLDETPKYRMAVFRSFSDSLRRWIDHASAGL